MAMSHQAVSAVLERAEATGLDRLVLLVLAEHADAHGRDAYPSVKTIARKAGCSRRRTQQALRNLEASALIERTGISRAGTVSYQVAMGVHQVRPGAHPSAPGGRTVAPQGAHTSAHEPPGEPSENDARAAAERIARRAGL